MRMDHKLFKPTVILLPHALGITQLNMTVNLYIGAQKEY